MNHKVIVAGKCCICGKPIDTDRIFLCESCGKKNKEYQEDKSKCVNIIKEYKEQTLIHEMVHGMLVCIGRNDLTDDEVFVQSLANAIYTSSFNVMMEEK